MKFWIKFEIFSQALKIATEQGEYQSQNLIGISSRYFKEPILFLKPWFFIKRE